MPLGVSKRAERGLRIPFVFRALRARPSPTGQLRLAAATMHGPSEGPSFERRRVAQGTRDEAAGANVPLTMLAFIN